MNEIKIDGILCNKKEAYTQTGKCITSFGLNFYNGKKDGKAVYDFIDCKMFDKTEFKNKDRVNLTGWLWMDSWEKDGKTYKKIVIIIKSLERQRVKDKPVDNSNDDFGCDIPF